MPPKQTDASLDGQLDLKKRSRRRLVGAAALALLAAIVLPMVMDREPRQPAQDVQVKIPSQDGGGLASRALPTKPTAMPLPAPESEPTPALRPEAKPPEKHQEAVAPLPVTVEKPVAKVAEKPAEKAVDKPADKPVDKAVAKATDKPNEKPASARSEEAKALAALSGATVAADQWVVQLGAYKEAGNIKVLLAKLKQMGVPAYTENFESPQGVRTRVRAGPFKSRDDAEKAKIKIRIIGVDGPVAPK